ncbi:hypothetical protein CDAR_449721 [Caerostris darwini]|uniref:Uncharacterized protein n=1 Tax=Caerostris darwini TaxID=1538125 RepID=A0AAV4QVB3_9ARAC|nr:hypothetical protein CDAR_449721 [Caerostris darwini]
MWDRRRSGVQLDGDSLVRGKCPLRHLSHILSKAILEGGGAQCWNWVGIIKWKLRHFPLDHDMPCYVFWILGLQRNSLKRISQAQHEEVTHDFRVNRDYKIRLKHL